MAAIQPIRQAPVANLSQQPNISVGLTNLQGFELAQRAAKLLASSSLVPKEYQNNLANCVIALNMAQRVGADPLMVMQNLVIVHNRPTWASQFLIATFNSCGKFSPIRYKFQGTEGTDSWGCRAVATDLATNEELTGPLVTIEIAKAEGWYSRSGSKWKTMPEQMLRYRAASWFVRTTAPELSMGLHTSEEIHDTYDAEVVNGTYEVTPETLTPTPPAAAAPAPAPELVAETLPVDLETGEVLEIIPEDTDLPPWQELWDENDPHADLKTALAACMTQADISKILNAMSKKEKEDTVAMELITVRTNELKKK